ncbi:DUF2158 domain-containing protein [Bradyrhizobium oligotrophicum]|uniref:DUF2158 domain-containing protein n=1 Tax=Bradyrhizobium oligotrophicum TaxID=44255 RepID=UPI003EBBFF56
METEIKPGNVVQLRSGGPLMTVRWIGDEYGEPVVVCDWFIQDKAPWKKETGNFPPTSLKIVEQ